MQQKFQHCSLFLSVFVSLCASNLLINCVPQKGKPGANGASGSVGTTRLNLNIISVHTSTAVTFALSGPTCSAVWYNSNNIAPGSITKQETTATCVYSLTSTRNNNLVQCSKQLVLTDVPEGTLMIPDNGATGCSSSSAMSCLFYCWNSDGSGEVVLGFTAT